MRSIPYATQWIDEDDIRAVIKALKSKYLTQGPLVAAFEKAIASYCGAKYAVAVNSGTSALHIACLAAGLKKGDEAITSPTTFAASANCVLYCGAKPIFADIREDTACLDVEEIKKKLSPKTKAIIPVDFAGHPVDLSEIRAIADEKGLLIIEDAAHALGAKYRGSNVGSGKYADMTIFSFHAVKHITTGEGGMVLTNNDKLYEKLKIIRTHGITRDPALLTSEHQAPWHYEMQALGFNYRLTDLQCALGINQLKKLPLFLKRRKKIVAIYNEAFTGNERLTLLKELQDVDSAHHLYVLRFNFKRLLVAKERVFNEYRRQGIGVNVHYMPVYLHPYYRKLGYQQGGCLNAENYYAEALTLPLFPEMSDSDVKVVIRATEKIIDKFKKD